MSDYRVQTILQDASDGDILKNKTDATMYYQSANLWYGSFDEISITSGYKTYSSTGRVFTVVGEDASSVPLPVYAGWNMFPYLVPKSLPLSEALDGRQFMAGDFIKTRTQASELYDLGNGQKTWYGSLTEMHPGEGYMLRSGRSFQYVYPDDTITRRKLSSPPRTIRAHPSFYYIMGLVITATVVRRNGRSRLRTL
jgi:hypothetical protein